jgi:phosphate/sulfate permease
MQANSFASSVGAKALTMVQVPEVALHAAFFFQTWMCPKRLPAVSHHACVLICCAQAVIVAGICEFLGAALLGAGVTGERAQPSHSIHNLAELLS